MTDTEHTQPEQHGLTRRRFLQASAVAAAAASLPIESALAGGGGCDVFGTPAEFMGAVPTPEDVLGFAIGVDREVTVAESNAYVEAIPTPARA